MTAPDTVAPTERPLSLDDVFALLSDSRRRAVLYALKLLTTPVGLPTVADVVTEWEHDRPPEDAPRRRQRVYLSLYHDTVPALVEASVVSYEQRDDALELAANAEQVFPYLEPAARRELADRYAWPSTSRE